MTPARVLGPERSPAERDAQVFGEYSEYYDLLYRDKDYAGEAAYIERVLRRAVPSATHLLEFGSGTGKHGRLLARGGYHVKGVERSRDMVAAAMTAASEVHGARGSFECSQGDIRDARVSGGFDAVLSLFHVVSYQTTNADLRATFANAARHLRPGGVFFFDVWHGPAVLNERPAVRVKRMEDERHLLRRIAEPSLDTNAGVVTVRYTMLVEQKQGGKVVTIEEEHRMRYLFPTEIELLGGLEGFVVEASEEFGSGAPPTDRTWGVAYLLRKS